MTKKNSSLSLAIFCLYEIDRFISRISFVCPRFRRLGVLEKSNEGVLLTHVKGETYPSGWKWSTVDSIRAEDERNVEKELLLLLLRK